MVKRFSFLILFICVNVFAEFSFCLSQEKISIKAFDSQSTLGFSIGNDTSSLGCPIVSIKGKKNIFEVQCKRIFLGIPVNTTTIKTSSKIISSVRLTISLKNDSQLHTQLSNICASLTEKRTNSVVTERLYSFVDGYRVSSKISKNYIEVDITVRNEYSFIQKGNVELIPFYGFDIGEPTSLMRGYDVRGPVQRFSFRPNARIAGVALYSQFVKVDEKGKIQSMHLVTDPKIKKDSDDLIAYFRRNSIRSKKKQNETDLNTFVFKNGYTIVVLEEKKAFYHFMITKSNNSSN